jgi:methionine aminotransferase
MPRFTSKLPAVGTTIFTVITQRAQALGAINLAQGFPDYDPPPLLQELLIEHAQRGDHQYAPMAGVPVLREQIAAAFARHYGAQFDPVDEITITLGATEALFSSILALVHPGDEVIMFDPSYDSYAPAVQLAGGIPVHIPLSAPEFTVDWDRVRSHLTPRTRLIIVNTPHNPTGSMWSFDDLAALERLVENTDILILADEVYEHMAFDGCRHVSLCTRAVLRDRTISVFSFGKPLHATGWRVGYAIATAEITRELRRVHQFNTFTIATPLQRSIADFLVRAPAHYDQLGAYYQAKRDRFIQGLQGTPLRVRPSQGTYSQLVDFREVSDLPDEALADELIRKAGVAAIPISPFYAQPPRSHWLRFCFAKQEATLDEAVSRIRAFVGG